MNQTRSQPAWAMRKTRASRSSVLLKPNEPSVHLPATNYTNVGVAQAIAYVDFGFIEPTVLATVAKKAKEGKLRQWG